MFEIKTILVGRVVWRMSLQAAKPFRSSSIQQVLVDAVRMAHRTLTLGAGNASSLVFMTDTPALLYLPDHPFRLVLLASFLLSLAP